MSFDRSSAGRGGSRSEASSSGANNPGKRTLTEQMMAPIQARSSQRSMVVPHPPDTQPETATAADVASHRESPRATLELLFGGHLGRETGQDVDDADPLEEREDATADQAGEPRLGRGPDTMLGGLPARAGSGAILPQIQKRAPERHARAHDADATREVAASGTGDGGGPLPYFDQIQRLFGRHDIAHVKAHTDARATEAAQAMQAKAFATGDHVAFAGTPSLHTAAHEAAHVVQQRSGVQLKGGVGEEGDRHERHADEVADRVVRGQSAEGVLDAYSGPGGTGGYAPPGAPVQLLRTRKQFLNKVIDIDKEKQQEALTDIANAIDAYHRIRAKKDPTCQQRLRALKDLDGLIYVWFSTFVAGGIAETPNGTLLQGLVDETRKEHEKLIATIAEDPSLLPIDTTGMTQEEQEQLLALWRSIVDGTGNLKITGDKKFTRRMRAGIAKLLQTDTGRTLLARLNARQDSPEKTVTLGPGFKDELKALGRDDPKNSEAVPRTPATKDNKLGPMVYASVLESSLTGEDRVETYGGEKEGPAEFTKFITGLPSGTTHFRYGGQLYKLGQGVGSYVKMVGGSEAHVNIGTRGQDVLTPEFVTIGHELGHALRMLTGTTVPFRENLDKFGFRGSGIERKFWNNAEEYVNIRGVENKIREEHGIDERMFHASGRKVTQAPVVKDRIEQIVGNGTYQQKYQTEYNVIYEIEKRLILLNIEQRGLETKKPKPGKQQLTKEQIRQARQIEHAMAAIDDQITAILLSEETRIALDTMDRRLREGASSSEDRTSMPPPSSKKEPVDPKSSPNGKDDEPTRKEELDEASSSEDLSENHGAPGVVVGGSPYEILRLHSDLKAKVPVGENHSSDGGPSGESVESEKAKSNEGLTHVKLLEEGYEDTKQALALWLKQHGIRVVGNGGGGRNNCLVISLLQHATRDYSEPASETVEEFKKTLATFEIGEDDPLFPTDPPFVQLVQAINLAYQRDLKVVYIQAFGDLNPPYALLESNIGTDPVVIWDKLGHYEALTL